uniref:Uncharacterized protein n=2 Tax=Corethron hystrix TaxID=216773 RepID=A0A7S1FTS5_9STRA|mmetsp:Transcript_28568/g.65320  ORF Transcript_28568/g.65320 Transcript_28568/m.65320 type:complete len:185 (+) Transcript_28568:271-825(+)|eukprot:CAMPEP_0113314584 /NCGR_PEP_ID=MMETSP0010_2-20120614/10584_1 /TAXON_ID=216773 ORGANISM="Corethron hystrix, Strain 308" /NCGR_SAMPLE_ID=MMETSP0010_2 /ASSEMBLY_ACC=CAM_ASM_000155 /LENGTH=184 /DNA_ID=CAMNT_0000170895 /DNA_START=55 /DNA_END=609 /DNA_ORIENTATION=+ /assembly_acc=CAM_ASM_000155
MACLSGMCLSPMVAFTQKELVNVVVLREIARRTAAEVDHLEEENKNLIMEITKLEGNANRLEDVEDALKKIYELQDQSLTEYADQVAVMKKNAAKIQNNTESNILKFIMYSAMKNDADGDSGLNDDEAKVIMQEISDLFGVKVHQDRFMEVVQANRNIGHIIASLKRRSVATDPDLKVFEAEHV